MSQGEKKLLLKDLCARLSYGVKVHCEWNQFQGDRISEDGELVSVNIYSDSIHFKRNSGRITEIPFNRIDGTVLPYLRPMSSMTEEEKKKLNNMCTIYNSEPTSSYEHFGIEVLNISRYGTNFKTDYTVIDWLNSHHFDYRGLIKKGLALEAPEGMYNIK